MRLVELGVFEHPSRIELIDGVILDMAAEGAEHGEVKMKIADQIYDQLDPAKHRRYVETTLRLDATNGPSPDIFVTPAGRHLRDLHASEVLLVVEVAESSLRKDTEVKSQLYAKYGISEYWVVDLEANEVLVFRPIGNGEYEKPQTYSAGELIHCRSVPNVTLELAEMRP